MNPDFLKQSLAAGEEYWGEAVSPPARPNGATVT
jgi:hypothetical protein